MRIFILVVAAAVLAGCTFKSTTVRRAEAPPPTVVYTQPTPTVVYGTPTVVYPTNTTYAAPTVAYTVGSEVAFDQAAVRAADWCRNNYGDRARLHDTRRGSTGDVVTFECVSG
jgi:hypothetical protein